MTDLANLRTASLYINNQLLSRGLLRNGRAIDFADPAGGRKGSDKDDKKDGTESASIKPDDHTAETMARIISVVNDLILRRDRDAEHRESLSTALRTVRAESLRQANDLQRALERHAETQRRADLGDAAEASLRAQLAAADAANKKLREEAARMRQQVAQTRASCANEVRKRDRQIDGLKKAVSDAGRARGERRNPAITTISITSADVAHQQHQQHQHTPRSGVVSSVQSTPTAHSSAAKGNTANLTVATTASEYDLRSETNAFLADLARGLSEDNELLQNLIRHTSRRLKTMSGYVGSDAESDGTASSGVADYGAMAVEMNAILDHLRTILTNPSFVPIEEVVMRESEIGRLRDGWEKMEGRWKEAVHLLDGWRRRMAVSGRPVNMEEIKMGLRLSPVRVRNVAETSMGLDLRLPPLNLGTVGEEAEEEVGSDGEDDANDNDPQHWPPLGRTPSPAETLHLVPAPEALDYEPGHAGLSDSESDTSSIFADDVDDDLHDDDEPNVQIIEQSLVMPSFEDSPALAVFKRSTPSPSPPPPEKPVLSKVTTAAIQEKEKQREEEAEQPKAVEPKSTQPGLRPSQTAGNRGAIGAAAPGTKTSSSTDVKKEAATTTTVTRGRRRPDEVGEAPKDRKQVRIVAAATTAEKPSARPAATRVVASTTTGTSAATGLRRANSARTTGGRPAPATRPTKPACRPVSMIAQDKLRPASAASQASEVSAASSSTTSEDSVALVPSTGTAVTSSRPLSSLASRKPITTASSNNAPTTARSRLDRANRPTSEEKTVPAPTASSSSSSEQTQMPPPPAPTSTAATANRARSRSPIKMTATSAVGTGSAAAAPTTTATASFSAVAGVTSRLPLPTSSGIPPPASPALNMATIAAKLAASEREADAARVRAKLKAARSGLLGAAKARVAPVEAPAAPAAAGSAASIEANGDPVKKTVDDEAGSDPLATSINSTGGDQQQLQQQPLRKKRDTKDKDQRRVSKAASRRRSTLNPWELKTLMSGSVEGAAPPAESIAAAP